MANIMMAMPDSDSGTVSGPNQGGYIETNLQEMQPTRTWRSTNSTATLTFDFGAGNPTTPINFVGLLFTNMLEGDTWQITAGAYDSGVMTLTADDVGDYIPPDYRPHLLHYIPAGVQQQNWSISLTTAQSYIEAGRLYISSGLVPTLNASYGYQIGWSDPSAKQMMLGGHTQVIDRVGGNRKRVSFALDYLTDLEFQEYFRYVDRNRGRARDVMVIKDPEDTEYRQDNSVYGLIDELRPFAFVRCNTYTHSKRYQVTELI